MKPLTNLITVLTLLIFSTNLFANDRINGREASNACKQEITSQYSSESDIKFSKNPASSLKGGAYKLWINSTEKVEGEKNSIRYLCEITRTGELVGLTRESGRWKI